MLFVTRADRIVLWVTLAYAREYRIQHYAYAPVTKSIARELSRYIKSLTTSPVEPRRLDFQWNPLIARKEPLDSNGV